MKHSHVRRVAVIGLALAAATTLAQANDAAAATTGERIDAPVIDWDSPITVGGECASVGVDAGEGRNENYAELTLTGATGPFTAAPSEFYENGIDICAMGTGTGTVSYQYSLPMEEVTIVGTVNVEGVAELPTEKLPTFEVATDAEGYFDIGYEWGMVGGYNTVCEDEGNLFETHLDEELFAGLPTSGRVSDPAVPTSITCTVHDEGAVPEYVQTVKIVPAVAEEPAGEESAEPAAEGDAEIDPAAEEEGELEVEETEAAPEVEAEGASVLPFAIGGGVLLVGAIAFVLYRRTQKGN
jgi:hypothetical protein